MTLEIAGETRSDARMETSEGPALREHRDREVSPTGMHRWNRDREVSPTGMHRNMKHPQPNKKIGVAATGNFR